MDLVYLRALVKQDLDGVLRRLDDFLGARAAVFAGRFILHK
jgi:hypothetical protein